MYSKLIAASYMRVQVFADPHGAAVASRMDLSADRIIIDGDLVDSHCGLDETAVLTNFLEIIKLKQSFPQKVILIWGNHDVTYLVAEPPPGLHNIAYNKCLHHWFNKYKELFQAAYQVQNWLFTHAGLTKPFWQDVLHGSGTDYASVINRAFSENPRRFFDWDCTRIPFWLYRDYFKDHNLWLPNLIQVVGHTIVWEHDRVDTDDSINSRIYYTNTGGLTPYIFRILITP